MSLGIYRAASRFAGRRAASQEELAPDAVADLLAWYDASDSSTLEIAPETSTPSGADQWVGRWIDKSGNGFDATQQQSNQRPYRKLGVQAGLDALLFLGESSSGSKTRGQRFETAIDSRIDEVSIFAVYKPDSYALGNLTNTTFLIGGIRPDNARWNMYYTDANGGEIRNLARANSGSYDQSLGSFNTGWNIQVLQGTASSIKGGLNSASLVSADHGLTLQTNPGKFRIGDGQSIDGDTNWNNAFVGYIGEIVFYNRLLTGQETSGVYAHLASKWGKV